MNKNIPVGYPDTLSDDKLVEKVKWFQVATTERARGKEIIEDGYYENLVDLGISELMRRNLEKQIEENIASRRINYYLNGITIVLAIITSFVGYQTLKFTQVDQQSDIIWMQRQIDNLKANNDELIELNENLNSILLIQESDSTSY